MGLKSRKRENIFVPKFIVIDCFLFFFMIIDKLRSVNKIFKSDGS